MKKPLPLILDTDIGSDIDDTWALAMILRSPELDLRMVTTTAFDTTYQAKLAAKMLEVAGRTDVIVGVGVSAPKMKNMDGNTNQGQWVEDYDLEAYPNLRKDGVDAMVEYIMASEERITVLAIGPCNNLAEAIKKEPRITEKSRLVFIGASLYNNAFPGWYPPLGRESNINVDIEAYRIGVEKNDWEVELLPLDVSGNVNLDKHYFDYIKEKAKTDVLLGALIENNDIWMDNMNWERGSGRTSPLFDTVGVYALITRENIVYQDLPVYVSDKGITLIDPTLGKWMDCGIKWIDKEKFYKFLTARLCGEI